MKKDNRYIQIPANILLGIAIVFFLIGMFGKATDAEANVGSFDTVKYNEDWTLIRDDSNEQITLPMVISSPKGEVVRIKNELPDDLKGGMRMFLRSSMQDTRVYVDGTLRECYEAEAFDYVGAYIPSAYIMVDLTEKDAGKTVEIQLTTRKQGRLNEISLGYGNNAWYSVLNRNIPVTVATIVAIIVGVLASVTYFFMRKTIKNSKAILYLGQAMVIIGLWILSESEIRQLIFKRPSYSAFFAYMLIELIAGFIAMYFDEIQKHKYTKVYTIVEILVFGQASINLVLRFAGVAEFHTTLIYSHVWMALGIAVAIATVIIDLKSGRIKEYSISAWGMLLFLVFCIFEIFSFYFWNFYIVGAYMCAGLIVLLIVTIVQILTDEIEKIKGNVEMEMFQQELERKVEEQTIELRLQQEKAKNLFIQTITALSEAVDAKDRYTSGHSKRVAQYARLIAAKMGKSKEEQEMIYRAGLLHDVGKIRVPADIINKPGKLTDEEYNIIKIHPITGYRILEGITDDNFIAIAAKYHHERYDGKGYPNGLIGDRIPEVARILGVADAYDAMASNRSYRNALPQNIVREEIKKCKGTQFDPAIADIMLRMIDEDKDYSMKQTDSMQRKILTVDDEPMNNKIIAHIMRDEPMYEIITATGGREALDILENQTFDLILLDVKMPDMDGLETLKLIREKYRTPVVLMTSDKTLDISTGFSELGCDDYITKPFLPLLIKEVIHMMTERTEMTMDV
ncbi:MAG: response regulator [Lachnospiraceae bacterium]|nr:response regulator [Lachnospiraceae bacterium]